MSIKIALLLTSIDCTLSVALKFTSNHGILEELTAGYNESVLIDPKFLTDNSLAETLEKSDSLGVTTSNNTSPALDDQKEIDSTRVGVLPLPEGFLPLSNNESVSSKTPFQAVLLVLQRKLLQRQLTEDAYDNDPELSDAEGIKDSQIRSVLDLLKK